MNQHKYCVKCNEGILTAILTTFTSLTEKSDNNYCFFWGSQDDVDGAPSKNAGIIVNHYRNSREITRTEYLVQNLRQLSGRFNFDASFLPLTLLLPHERHELLLHLKNIPLGEYFFLKPCALASGTTAYKVRNIHDYKLFQELHKNHLFHAVKMPTEPLQFKNFSVYMYFYVLITSFERLQIYRYEEPLCILVQNNENLDKNSEKRSKSPFGFSSVSCQMSGSTTSKGNKQDIVCLPFIEFISLLDFNEVKEMQKRLQKQTYDQKMQIFSAKDELRDFLINKMTDAAIIIMKSAQKQIRMSRDRQFEIFELKFQLGTDLKPYLLGVSAAPSVGALGGRTFQTKLFKNSLQTALHAFGQCQNQTAAEQEFESGVNGKNAGSGSGYTMVCIEERGRSFTQWLHGRATVK